MSGTIAQQILALQADIANLNVQIAVDTISNPGLVPGLQAQVALDNAQILALQALCFLAGTHILTDRGEVLIEDLQVGNSVVTPHGEADCATIRWIGRQHIEGARSVYGQPVLIQAGALGEGFPHRDLRVSGDHCLFVDGHLVPARLLVNGATILAEADHLVLDYFNIELDRHTIVVAEGVETESYLDCGNRARFDNASETCEWLSTRPERDASAWFEHAFALPIWSGAEFDAIHARLAGHIVREFEGSEGVVAAQATLPPVGDFVEGAV